MEATKIVTFVSIWTLEGLLESRWSLFATVKLLSRVATIGLLVYMGSALVYKEDVDAPSVVAFTEEIRRSHKSPFKGTVPNTVFR